MKNIKKILICILASLICFSFFAAGCSESDISDLIDILTATQPSTDATQPSTDAIQTPTEAIQPPTDATQPSSTIAEDGIYTSVDDVAAYIRTYGHLPGNYITKNQANALGWQGGDLWRYAPGKSIGGDRFGNYEEILPDAPGRKWTECDIDYNGGSRNAKRLVFSNDGLIYYTSDHYKTFKEIK